MKITLVLAVVVAALGGALLATVFNDDDDDQASLAQASPAQVAPQQTPQATQPAAESTPANRDRSRQRSAPRYIDPEDRPIGRRELSRVRDAALQAVGGGTVTDIDRSDDYGVAYEVEVVENGMDVDVRLNRSLEPVATDYDD